jgi:hypothetical protein
MHVSFPGAAARAGMVINMKTARNSPVLLVNERMVATPYPLQGILK